MKKLLCTFLAVMLSFSIIALPVSAANSKSVSLSTNRAWSSNVKCTLKKSWGKVQNGTVRVKISNWGTNVDIRMRNGSKVIWSQNNAIKSGGNSAYVYRDFSLGNDHSYYDLSFRVNKSCYAAPALTVTNQKNVTIS